ncbi:MAG: transposase [Chloroflexota bacterium]
MHPFPSDPPRRQANKRRGRGGAMANDRPPILGIWGRTSGQVQLIVIDDTTQATIVPLVVAHTLPCSTLYTDECNAFNPIAATGRSHSRACHSRREWARNDADGIREVHSNSMEGIWTGLRNCLRPFRGVHKRCLA